MPRAETERTPVTNIIHHQNFRAITALDAQKRKRHLAGSDVLKDGEALHFSINLIDSAAHRITDAERASIDAMVREGIEAAANLQGKKASEWLITAQPLDIEKIITKAAKAYVTALGGEAIAKSFALDSAVRIIVDAQHGAHDGKFQFMGDAAPAFDRERATFLARSKFGLHLGDSGTAHPATVAAERTRSLAGARFGDGAKLVDMGEGDKPAPRSLNAATGTQDAAQAKPAAISALRAARYS